MGEKGGGVGCPDVAARVHTANRSGDGTAVDEVSGRLIQEPVDFVPSLGCLPLGCGCHVMRRKQTLETGAGLVLHVLPVASLGQCGPILLVAPEGPSGQRS